MADKIFLRGARVFDGVSDEARQQDVLIADNRIVDVGAIATTNSDIRVIDLAGKLLMPGLIDAHVHICGAELPIINTTSARWSYLAAFAFRLMRQRLMSGFTTLRDMGGADVGIARALREGLVDGPRLFYSGKIISQTGGHGDSRPRDHDIIADIGSCCSGRSDKLAWVVDGVPEVRRAIREELRLGAHQIKIMASGGVISPAGNVYALQFSDSEILAAVEEARNHGTYVSAHCHPAAAIRRCAQLGVRVIEHATMMDEDAAAAMIENKTYAVPTLAILDAFLAAGRQAGLKEENMDKLDAVVGKSRDSVRLLRRSGIPIGFGTDLFGKAHGQELTEFSLRKNLERPADILRSATSVNAEIIGKAGELGCIAKGALADVIAVDGDALSDISVMEDAGNVAFVMLDGQICKSPDP